ncbi:MAG: DUF3630 family protein [Mucilaginibacter sp.]|uniref:DUF3630 family protein n=1 Tax=Mucilaginibacter sp. TaxID=1882438 RepID=UPI0032664A9C
MKLKDNPIGFKEIVVVDSCDFEEFYLYAEKLKSHLGIVYTKQIDDFDSLYWQFVFEDSIIVLSYDTFLGISIYPQDGNKSTLIDNQRIEELYKLIKSL